MDLQQLKISCPSGIGDHAKVELNGEEIGQDVRGIVLRLQPGYVVTAQLDLIYLGGEFEGQAQVVLPEDTQALLKRLGWTPPAEGAEDGG
jgi:hypothetical protein